MTSPFTITERTIPVTEVYCDGVLVEMPPQQAAIAKTLIDAGGEYVSRDDLMAAIGSTAEPKIIEVLVCKLRRALESHHHTAPIQSAYGRGWRWIG